MAKIMQINITCGRGSTGDIAARLYHACEAEGYNSRFAYASFEPTITSAFRIETKLQHYFRRGMNKFFGKRQSHSTPGTKRLIRYIQKEKPDLLHIHNVQQNSLNYIMFFEFLKNADIPAVFTLHDCWSFTGGCYHFFKNNCDKYVVGSCGNCTLDLDDLSITAGEAYDYKKILIGGNNKLHVVCVSEWLKSVASKSYMGFMKHPPTVIYNGIDTSVFYPKKTDIRKCLRLQENDFIILGVAGYWNNGKGLHYFEKLSEIMPKDCKIILVGQVREQSQKTNDKLIYVPQTQSREQLAELYSCADLYANLSLEETFGLTTAEALACGTPAIVFNTTACPEVIDDNTGIQVEFKNDFDSDIQAIMDAINIIKANKKESYTNPCVERIQSHFTTEKMTGSYLKLYRRIISGIH